MHCLPNYLTIAIGQWPIGQPSKGSIRHETLSPVVAIVEPLFCFSSRSQQIPFGMWSSYEIPIQCETRKVRIGSAIAATLLADPAIVANRADIVAFKVRIGSLVIAVDSIGSWRMGAAA